MTAYSLKLKDIAVQGEHAVAFSIIGKFVRKFSHKRLAQFYVKLKMQLHASKIYSSNPISRIVYQICFNKLKSL